MNAKNSAFGQQFDMVGNDAFLYSPYPLFCVAKLHLSQQSPTAALNLAQHVQFSLSRCSVTSLVLQQCTVLSLGGIY